MLIILIPKAIEIEIITKKYSVKIIEKVNVNITNRKYM